jgi:hypothetical protein
LVEPLDPVTVWMVNLDRGEADNDVKGRLRVEDGALVFTNAADRTPVPLAFDAIRRARRLRASPVLMVEWHDGSRLRRTAFYFVQPPPLHAPEPGSAPTPDYPYPQSRGPWAAFRRTSKRRHMKNNVRYLQTAGINRKELIQAWADEVSARSAGGGRG